MVFASRTLPPIFRVVSAPLLAGTVLLSAGLLKVERLFSGRSSTGHTLDVSFLFDALFIEVEFAVGLALLFRIWPRLVRLTAMVLFAGFAVAGSLKAARGASSCGCFGDVILRPEAAV